jgi:hypothetical protein
LLGEKTFVNIFPEILDKVVSVDDIIERAEELQLKVTNEKSSELKTGKTKRGVLGKEFFDINKKLVDLSNPMISDEGKEEVELYLPRKLDPEGRGYQNLMRMMTTMVSSNIYPNKMMLGWNFLQPFMKLTRKEKKRFKNKN